MTRPFPSTPGDAELRLPRPPGVFRRWLAAHPRVVDGVIVGVYLFGCTLMVAIELFAGFVAPSFDGVEPSAAEEMRGIVAHLTWPWILVSVLIVAIVALALAYRRRFPLAGLAAVSLLLFLEQGLLVLPNSVALVFLLYAVPVYRGVRAGWAGYGFAVAANTVLLMVTGSGVTGAIGPAGIVASGAYAPGERVVVAIVNALWLLAVLMIGINLGNRRRYVEALIDRAHQLAREREQRAQLAAAAERARIAREMHDIVAHSLSVVVTLSEAASVAAESQPAAARQAMERAAETGRAALVEMRRLLGVLNEGEGAEDQGDATSGALRSPQPGMREVQELVDGFREAGLRVVLTEQGVRAGDATQQLAVFRILQEALTNALRHAGPGASAEAVLEHSAEGTRIEVVDSGRPEGAAESAPALAGSGRGLAGARQRARVFGGELEAGPRGRGWRVSAFVPIVPGTGGAAGVGQEGNP